MAVIFEVVSSLVNNCLEKISKDVSLYENLFEGLPLDLKRKLTKKLSMRGLLKDCHLRKLLHPKTHSLNISSCDISDQGLQDVRTCKALIKLDLNANRQPRNNITPEGIIKLAESCVKLQTVSLRRCVRLNDDAVVALATHCPYLTNLNFGGCYQLTDKSLSILASNSHYLESLNVSHTQVSDIGLVALANGICHQTLKEIHFAHCPAVSDMSITQLIENCRLLNILIFHGCPRITETSRNALEIMQRRGSKQISWTVY